MDSLASNSSLTISSVSNSADTQDTFDSSVPGVSNSTGNVGFNNDTDAIGVLSKLLPFLVTDNKGDFEDFANREQLDRLQEQKGVSRPCCPKDKRFERAVNAGWRNSTASWRNSTYHGFLFVCFWIQVGKATAEQRGKLRSPRYSATPIFW